MCECPTDFQGEHCLDHVARTKVPGADSRSATVIYLLLVLVLIVAGAVAACLLFRYNLLFIYKSSDVFNNFMCVKTIYFFRSGMKIMLIGKFFLSLFLSFMEFCQIFVLMKSVHKKIAFPYQILWIFVQI